MGPADDILEIVRMCLAPGYRLLGGAVEQAPAERGAYALVLGIEAPLALTWRKETSHVSSGWYLYAGNANGAGGIRGRLRHHLRPGKAVHWHIDHLTNAASPIHVFTGAGGSECDIVARLSATGAFQAPLAGFGSSDCRHCRSHLLRFAPERH